MKSERSTGTSKRSTLEGGSPPATTPAKDTGESLRDKLDEIADETHIVEVPESLANGLSPGARRWFDRATNVVLAFFAASWLWALVWGPPAEAAAMPSLTATRTISTAITKADAPSTAFLTDAAVRSLAFRGRSGKLLARFETPGDSIPADSLPEGAHVVAADSAAPGDTIASRRPAGVWRLALAVGQAIRPVADMSIITMRPFGEKQRGRIGSYMIGSWPAEGGRAVKPRYENPRGFIEVTAENQNTRVSEHFTLRDFLTKGQVNVWPKYLVLEPRLLDKLELMIAELEKAGVKVEHVTVMSGFRTPSYNAGGGNTAGRAGLSRHMYGDASDVFVDNDRNGTLDDLNGDGRSDIRDVEVMAQAVERVERTHPDLVGGIGRYIACCGHGPFIHIDTRGYRARWNGSSGG